MVLLPQDIPTLIGLLIIILVGIISLVFLLIELIKAQSISMKSREESTTVFEYFRKQDKKMD